MRKFKWYTQSFNPFWGAFSSNNERMQAFSSNNERMQSPVNVVLGLLTENGEPVIANDGVYNNSLKIHPEYKNLIEYSPALYDAAKSALDFFLPLIIQSHGSDGKIHLKALLDAIVACSPPKPKSNPKKK